MVMGAAEQTGGGGGPRSDVDGGGLPWDRPPEEGEEDIAGDGAFARTGLAESKRLIPPTAPVATRPRVVFGRSALGPSAPPPASTLPVAPAAFPAESGWEPPAEESPAPALSPSLSDDRQAALLSALDAVAHDADEPQPHPGGGMADDDAGAPLGKDALLSALSAPHEDAMPVSLDEVQAAPGEVPTLHSDRVLYVMWFALVGALVAGLAVGLWAVFLRQPY
jgi:hypothetical protein